MKYFIVTFGCQANVADSERIKAVYSARGYYPAQDISSADCVVINTCMIRQSAEDRVYGLVRNLTLRKKNDPKLKIIVTGCMAGMAVRDKTGKLYKQIKNKMPGVDEFLPIEEVGFDYPPLRGNNRHALIPITNGCNNFCTFCVVPMTRGREVSRPYQDIISECRQLASDGYASITLVGQNVNSYGADILMGPDNIQVLRDLPDKKFFQDSAGEESGCNSPSISGEMQSFNPVNAKGLRNFKPTYVKHLGRMRIPTMFPYLLRQVSKIKGISKIDFISSNPWDFSDDLITVIAETPKISRQLHIAVQSGDDQMLRKMNRWYTKDEYLDLVGKLRKFISGVEISTDIIVGFCGETRQQFENTVDLCRQAKFYKAYVSIYSDRPATAAHRALSDDIPLAEKKRRWLVLEELINKPYLEKLKTVSRNR